MISTKPLPLSHALSSTFLPHPSPTYSTVYTEGHISRRRQGDLKKFSPQKGHIIPNSPIRTKSSTIYPVRFFQCIIFSFFLSLSERFFPQNLRFWSIKFQNFFDSDQFFSKTLLIPINSFLFVLENDLGQLQLLPGVGTDMWENSQYKLLLDLYSGRTIWAKFGCTIYIILATHTWLCQLGDQRAVGKQLNSGIFVCRRKICNKTHPLGAALNKLWMLWNFSQHFNPRLLSHKKHLRVWV